MIILLAALMMTTEPDYTLVFVSSFNGIEGQQCLFITQPGKSTLESLRIDAKRDGTNLYILTSPDQIQKTDSYNLFWTDPDGERFLSTGIIRGDSVITFHSSITNQLAVPQADKPTDSFLITTGTNFQGLKDPLSALIFTKNDVFSARYDQIGTIFVDKAGDFGPETPVSLIITDSSNQKWLYPCMADGKYLRYSRHKSPKGPF